EPPFKGATPFEVAMQHVSAEPEPLGNIRPDLPAELCALVHKMMAKDPQHRHASAGDLVQETLQLREALAAGSSLHTEALSLDLPAVPAAPTALVPKPARTGTAQPLRPSPPAKPWMIALLVVPFGLALAAGAGLGGLVRELRGPPAVSGTAVST